MDEEHAHQAQLEHEAARAAHPEHTERRPDSGSEDSVTVDLDPPNLTPEELAHQAEQHREAALDAHAARNVSRRRLGHLNEEALRNPGDPNVRTIISQHLRWSPNSEAIDAALVDLDPENTPGSHASLDTQTARDTRAIGEIRSIIYGSEVPADAATREEQIRDAAYYLFSANLVDDPDTANMQDTPEQKVEWADNVDAVRAIRNALPRGDGFVPQVERDIRTAIAVYHLEVVRDDVQLSDNHATQQDLHDAQAALERRRAYALEVLTQYEVARELTTQVPGARVSPVIRRIQENLYGEDDARPQAVHDDQIATAALYLRDTLQDWQPNDPDDARIVSDIRAIVHEHATRVAQTGRGEGTLDTTNAPQEIVGSNRDVSLVDELFTEAPQEARAETGSTPHEAHSSDEADNVSEATPPGDEPSAYQEAPEDQVIRETRIAVFGWRHDLAPSTRGEQDDIAAGYVQAAREGRAPRDDVEAHGIREAQATLDHQRQRDARNTEPRTSSAPANTDTPSRPAPIADDILELLNMDAQSTNEDQNASQPRPAHPYPELLDFFDLDSQAPAATPTPESTDTTPRARPWFDETGVAVPWSDDPDDVYDADAPPPRTRAPLTPPPGPEHATDQESGSDTVSSHERAEQRAHTTIEPSTESAGARRTPSGRDTPRDVTTDRPGRRARPPRPNRFAPRLDTIPEDGPATPESSPPRGHDQRSPELSEALHAELERRANEIDERVRELETERDHAPPGTAGPSLSARGDPTRITILRTEATGLRERAAELRQEAATARANAAAESARVTAENARAERRRPTQDHADWARYEAETLRDEARRLNDRADDARAVANEIHAELTHARATLTEAQARDQEASQQARDANNRADQREATARRAAEAVASAQPIAGTEITETPVDSGTAPSTEAQRSAREAVGAAVSLEERANELDQRVRELEADRDHAQPGTTGPSLSALGDPTRIATLRTEATGLRERAAELRQEAGTALANAAADSALAAAQNARAEATNLANEAREARQRMEAGREVVDHLRDAAFAADTVATNARTTADRVQEAAAARGTSADRVQGEVLPDRARLGHVLTSEWYRGQVTNVVDALTPHTDAMLDTAGITRAGVRDSLRAEFQRQAEEDVAPFFRPSGYQARVTETDGEYRATLRIDPNQVYRHVGPDTSTVDDAERLTVVLNPFYVEPRAGTPDATADGWAGQVRVASESSPTPRDPSASGSRPTTLNVQGDPETFQATLDASMTVAHPDGTETSSDPRTVEVGLNVVGGLGTANARSPEEITLGDPYRGQPNPGPGAARALRDSEVLWVGAITDTDGVSLADSLRGHLFGAHTPRLRAHVESQESQQGSPGRRTRLSRRDVRNYRADQPTFADLDNGSLVARHLPEMTYGNHRFDLRDIRGGNQRVTVASAPTHLRRLPNPPRYDVDDARGTPDSPSARESGVIVTADGTRIPRAALGTMAPPGSGDGDARPSRSWGDPDTSLYEVTRTFHVLTSDGQQRTFTGSTFELLNIADAATIADATATPTSGTRPDPGLTGGATGPRRPTEAEADQAQRHARNLRDQATRLAEGAEGARANARAREAERAATAAEERAQEMRRNALPETADLGSFLRSRFFGTQPINIGALESHIDSQLNDAGLDNPSDPVRGAVRSELLRQADKDMRPFFSPRGYEARVPSPDGDYTVRFRIDPGQVFRRAPRTSSGPLRNHPAPHRLAQTEGRPSLNSSFTNTRGGAKRLTIGALFTPFYIGPVFEGLSDPPNLGVRAQVTFSLGFRTRSHTFAASTSGGDSSIIELKGPTEPYQADLATHMTIVRPDNTELSATPGELPVTLEVPNGPTRPSEGSPDTITLTDPHSGEDAPGPGVRAADQSHPYATGPSVARDGRNMADDFRSHLFGAAAAHLHYIADSPEGVPRPNNKLRKNPPNLHTYQENRPTFDAIENGSYMMDNHVNVTNEWHDVSVVDIDGKSQSIAVTSTPIRYQKMPSLPHIFDFSSLTDATAGVTETAGKKSF